MPFVGCSHLNLFSDEKGKPHDAKAKACLLIFVTSSVALKLFIDEKSKPHDVEYNCNLLIFVASSIALKFCYFCSTFLVTPWAEAR